MKQTDVLIIGAGAAGVRTAIELEQNGIDTLILGKRSHGDAHTTWARGGINASLGNLDQEDSWEIHAADTLEEGHFINDAEAVETVTKNMPDRIKELDEWGMDFSRTESGDINQRYFGAQSYRRTCFAGDHTGESLLNTLVDKAKQLDIPYQEDVYITELLTNETGRVVGAAGYDMDTKEELVYSAEYTVLAAGGYSGIYDRHTSRDDENNGDGVALAMDVGAEIMDIEFMQFHPTGMSGYGDEWEGRLVTEAVRGEGGRLYNTNQERFMEKYSPEQMELDARDVVARAIRTEIQEGRGTENDAVYLDISHRDREFIKNRLPRMYERFQSIDVDIAEEPMEVAPTTHYSMGGVKIDAQTGQTTVDGLYAAGETTAGVHGANRLGGNSLAETVAIGEQIGRHLADIGVIYNRDEIPETSRYDKLRSDGEHDPGQLLERLRQIMQEHAGVVRSESSILEGLEKLFILPKSNIGGSIELKSNYLYSYRVAEILLMTALIRKESRGAHYREDYSEKDTRLRCNLVWDGDKIVSRSENLDISERVQSALDENHELDYHHLE
jgi:succinate dehydrogenase / fumarate reductase flavoprotein subunit